MKKNIFLILCFLCFGYVSFAQGAFEFWYGDGSEKMPDTLVIDFSEAKNDESIVKTYIGFKNVSDQENSIKIVGNKIGVWPAELGVSYCYNGCFEPGAMTGDLTLSPGEVFISENAGVSAIYVEFGHFMGTLPNGDFFFRFTTFTDASENDLIIKYEVRGDNSIRLAEKTPVKVDIYPNPASDNIKIKYDLGGIFSGNNQLIIRNLVGAVIKTIPLKSTEKEMTASVSDLSSGIYFYSLSIDGAIQNTKKLIIKR